MSALNVLKEVAMSMIVYAQEEQGFRYSTACFHFYNVQSYKTFGGNQIVTSKIIFQPNEKTVILEDIHECLEFGSSLCKNGRCSNTFGSYMCMCKIGFELDKNGVSCKQFRMT